MTEQLATLAAISMKMQQATDTKRNQRHAHTHTHMPPMEPKGPAMCPEIALHRSPQIHPTPQQGEAGPGGAAAPRLEAFDEFTSAVTSWLRDADVLRLFQSGRRPDMCADSRPACWPEPPDLVQCISTLIFSVTIHFRVIREKNKRTKPVCFFSQTP